IPIYVDAFGVQAHREEERFTPMTEHAGFLEFVKYARERGASFIYHGVTHQGGKRVNPFSGVSGDDFEFWDRVANRPMPGDSPEFVVNRIEDGLRLLEDGGIRPFAWLTPHYQASPL